MNDGKCALFIRTSVSGGIVSMSQMSRNLSPPRAEPVKRGLQTFSSLLSTVILVKNCRSKKGIKQCLEHLKCSQNAKKNKKTLEVNFKAIFHVHFANLVSKEYFSIQRLTYAYSYKILELGALIRRGGVALIGRRALNRITVFLTVLRYWVPP